MNIRLRYWTHYGYLVLLLLITATAAILALRSLRHVIEAIFQQDFQSAVASHEMIAAVELEDRRLLEALARPGDQRLLAVQLETSRERFMTALDRARNSVSDSAEADVVRRVRQAHAAYEDAVGRLLTRLHGEEGWPLYFSEVAPAFRRLRERLEELVSVNRAGMLAAGKQARSVARERTFVMSAVCALGLLSLFVMFRRLDEHVVYPLRRLRDATLAMAQGDSARRPPQVEAGEIGDLASAITEMADRFDRERAGLVMQLDACRRTVEGLVELYTTPAVLLSPAGIVLASNKAFAAWMADHGDSDTVRSLLEQSGAWNVQNLAHGLGSLYTARTLPDNG